MANAQANLPPALRGRETKVDAARSQIRGSSLLLTGRSLSIGVKLVAQVLVVRYLSTADYGAWAYALSFVTFLGGFAHLSLDRAVSRFASIDLQQQRYDRFFGTILLVTGAILTTGLVFAAGLYTFPVQFASLVGDADQPITLLFILIFLVPLEALDALLIAIFATFSRPRAIFFRRYVLAPVIQLGLVLLLIVRKADVVFLAWGYLTGAILGVAISVWLLVQILRRQGLLEHCRLRNLTVPVRELFAFSVPLMTSDWLSALVQSSGTLVLGYFYDTEQVALLRIVIPVAVLNQLVIQSFTLLYLPTASRLYAQGDLEGIRELYWRTALWISVLTFPIFTITFAAATPLTVLVFGARYEASGVILSILALGQYVQAGLGFNGATLKAMGKVRAVVVINALAAAANLALTLVLVPRFGAIGAAVSMSATMIVHNLLKQTGLHRVTGFGSVDGRYVRPFAIIGAGIAGLVSLRLVGIASPVILATAAVAVSAVVTALTRKTLRIGDIFPEVARIPLLRGFLT